METCEKQVDSFSVSRSIYLMGLFDWQLVKEERKGSNASVLYFSRDDSVPYYHKMAQIEKEMSPQLFPFWIFVSVFATAFACVTAYLVLFLVLRENFPTAIFFNVLFVPAMVLLFIGTALFYFRSKQQLNFIRNEQERLVDIQTKISNLKKCYGNQEKKD